jgi:hypothetical protein
MLWSASSMADATRKVAKPQAPDRIDLVLISLHYRLVCYDLLGPWPIKANSLS